jgi:hypothetical protein
MDLDKIREDLLLTIESGEGEIEELKGEIARIRADLTRAKEALKDLGAAVVTPKRPAATKRPAKKKAKKRPAKRESAPPRSSPPATGRSGSPDSDGGPGTHSTPEPDPPPAKAPARERTRARVLEHIEANPGCSGRELVDALGITQGTVSYATTSLENDREIWHRRVGKSKHWAIIGAEIPDDVGSRTSIYQRDTKPASRPDASGARTGMERSVLAAIDNGCTTTEEIAAEAGMTNAAARTICGAMAQRGRGPILSRNAGGWERA